MAPPSMGKRRGTARRGADDDGDADVDDDGDDEDDDDEVIVSQSVAHNPYRGASAHELASITR